MSVSLVLTVIAPDRPGLVEALSQAVARHEGNWLESRMARLGGQFAGILRVSVPDAQADALTVALGKLESDALRIVVARSADEEAAPQDRRFALEIVGSDRPGIIRDISQALADRGVNVDELRTGVESAPMSGELLFRAQVELRLPAGQDADELGRALESIAQDLMVDVSLEDPE